MVPADKSTSAGRARRSCCGRWPPRWSRIFSDDREGLLLSVPIAAGEVDPEWPKEPLTRERNDELLQSMLAGAARPEPYERASPKIARNDPCPCGNGKKYKRCCGRAGAQDANVH